MNLLDVTLEIIDVPFLSNEELPTPTPQQLDEFWAEYSSEVGKCLADNLPPIVDRLNVATGDDEFCLPPKRLLELRRAHETQFTKKAVRTANTGAVTEAQASQIQASRAQHSLVKRFREVLKLQQEIGKGTGFERQARWNSGPLKGNAANAASTAASRAAEVCT